MDERKRMLATAWRDLAGWSVGMVTDDDDVVIFGGKRTSDIRSGCSHFGGDPCTYEDICEHALPDPDAPANWGVWLAWAQREAGQRPKWLDYGDALPYELLQWYVEVCDRHKQQGVTPTTAMPPSVIAWWESEELSDWP